MLLNYNIIPSLIMVCCFITKRIFFISFLCLKNLNLSLTQIPRSLSLSLSLYLSFSVSLSFSLPIRSTDGFFSYFCFFFAIFICFIYQFMHCFSKGKKALALIFVSIFFSFSECSGCYTFRVFLLELN